MVYGIIGLINFAHGEVVMIGAMVSLSVITALVGAQTSLPVVVVILAGLFVAILVCMTIAYGMEKLHYGPCARPPRLPRFTPPSASPIVLWTVPLCVGGA